MKKFIAMLLTLSFCVAIVGCGEEGKTTTKKTETTTSTKTTGGDKK
jgi:hypothetical protein